MRKEAQLLNKANDLVTNEVFAHGNTSVSVISVYTVILQEFLDFWWTVSKDTKQKLEIVLMNLHFVFGMPNAEIYYEKLYGKPMKIPENE